MRRSLIAVLLVLAVTIPMAVGGSLHRTFAQTGTSGPQSDEFNANVFTAPFAVRCAANAAAPCPDPQGAATWSLNGQSPGFLRIMTQFGDLKGTAAQASNNARDLVLQPTNPGFDWTVTTKMTFPAAAQNVTSLGQTAGLIVYQDDDNFIYLARTFVGGVSRLDFLQEVNGVDTVNSAVEGSGVLLSPTVYLRLTKSTTTYTASFSYDNNTYTTFATQPTPVATSTPISTTAATPTSVPTATPTNLTYTATYAAPQVGLFALGGTNSAVSSNILPADFDWFRVGANALTPGPTAGPTSTATGGPTATSTAVGATSTPVVVTATAGPTNTPTAAPTSTPTNTPIPATPTPTPKPRPVTSPNTLSFKTVSIWYHSVKRGTFDHVDIQANHKRVLGIWAHVYFPNGRVYSYFTNTDAGGHWAQSFSIPRDAIGPRGNQGVVTLQLWEGKHTRKNFVTFTVL